MNDSGYFLKFEDRNKSNNFRNINSSITFFSSSIFFLFYEYLRFDFARVDEWKVSSYYFCPKVFLFVTLQFFPSY
jgi:hypothetical protein